LVKPKDFLDLLKEALSHLVSFVEPVPKLKLLLKDTIPLVGADSLWSEGYTGKGVKGSRSRFRYLGGSPRTKGESYRL
jgi:hypothetical protein